jgi:mono/diheme cytochrome c family protein/rhodanese-related sulfurtransferase
MSLRHACLFTVALAACGGARSDNGTPNGHDPALRDGGGGAPPSSDPRVAAGAAAYTKFCALCHGPEAKGYAADNAPSLVSKTFLESADDIFLARSIELGRPGTPMAGYGRDLGGPLSEQDIAGLIAFLRDKGGVKTPIAAPAPERGDPARGQPIYAEHCQKCHGDATTRLTAPHLANPTFQALASDGYLRYAVVFGRPGTPMESFSNRLDGNQVADVIAYLRQWTQPAAPEPPPPVPMPSGPVVINPKGKAPTFELREDRFVPAAQVAAALAKKQKVVIIDARPPSDWLRERVKGAISVPHYDTSTLDRVPNDGTWVLAYCACPHHASGVVVDELRKRGYKNTAIIDEGILYWSKQGYPIEGTGVGADGKSKAPPPTPPAAGADPHAGHAH